MTTDAIQRPRPVRSDSIRAVCRDDVPLATPFGDAATIVLAMGTSSPTLRYCAELGGDEMRNGASSLKRKNAPPPLACPLTECPSGGVVPSASVGSGCWYLAPGTSCDGVCGFFGLRYSEATRTFAGSDGTNANCDAVLAALGLPGAEDVDYTTGGLDGLGCAFPSEIGAPSLRCTTDDSVGRGLQLRPRLRLSIGHRLGAVRPPLYRPSRTSPSRSS